MNMEHYNSMFCRIAVCNTCSDLYFYYNQVFYVCLVSHFVILFVHDIVYFSGYFHLKKRKKSLIETLSSVTAFFCLQKQSCITMETCQNITRPQMLLEPDDYNCSRKLARNGNANGK